MRNDGLVDSRPPLTGRARCIYDYLALFIRTRGFAPTQRELAVHCGITSTGSVNYWLHKLQRDGYIRIEPGASRAIVIVEAMRAKENALREVA